LKFAFNVSSSTKSKYFHLRCVVLVPVENEDMWHAYNLIAEGDLVKASTIRKVCELLNSWKILKLKIIFCRFKMNPRPGAVPATEFALPSQSK
jgi:hypothetical protein